MLPLCILRSEINANVLEAIKDQSKKQGWSAPQSYDYAPGQFAAADTVPKLNQAKLTVVFFAG